MVAGHPKSGDVRQIHHKRQNRQQIAGRGADKAAIDAAQRIDVAPTKLPATTTSANSANSHSMKASVALFSYRSAPEGTCRWPSSASTELKSPTMTVGH